MENEFIPYEQALALKELGFDEPCFAIYNTEQHVLYIKPRKLFGDIKAPLYQQAFRWFKEKYLLEGLILPQIHSRLIPFPAYFIAVESYKDQKWEELFNSTTKENDSLHYENSEEAELECLKKLIEIIKNKMK